VVAGEASHHTLTQAPFAKPFVFHKSKLVSSV